MKRIVSLFIVFVFLFAKNMFAQDNNSEFRSIWVVTWDLISRYNSVSANKTLDEGIIKNLKSANMNAVLWHVRQSGTAYYSSNYEPWGYYAGRSYPGYDPLEYAIEQAHKRGMEVHVWFNTFNVSSTAAGTPASEHPEWICRDANGNPMTSHISISPGLPAVREYVIKVAMEIVRNYDIDGFHLDYIRWNEYTTSDMLKKISPEDELKILDGMDLTKERLEKIRAVPTNRYLWDVEHPYSGGVPQGFSSWEEWWRWSVTEFVKTLQDSIKSVKPWVRLSAAVLGRYNWGGWNGYYDVYQDAALWFNKGYVDQLTPMHYHWTTGSEFYNMLTGAGQDNWEHWIQDGINAGRLYSVGPGSYILDEKDLWNNHESIVEKCRTIDWVDGFQFFSYSSWKAHNYWDQVSKTFFSKVTKIRHYSQYDSIAPNAPSLSVHKIDPLHYEIQLNSNSDTTGVRYALYISKTSTFSKDTTQIYNIYFSKTGEYIDTISFDGTQSFTNLYVKATVFDRYWNESYFSALDSLSDIGSTPPTINYIYPASNDTIQISDSIVIKFSKSMDTLSVETSIRLDPSVGDLDFSWSDSNSTLIIYHNDFDKGVQYTLTISDNAKDKIGLSLDGNNDGEEGGDFVSVFFTYSNDDSPPYVEGFYPDNELINVDQVIAVFFNEKLDESTISDNINLFKNNELVDIDVVKNLFNNKHIVSIRPKAGFSPYADYRIEITDGIKDTSGNSFEGTVSYDYIVDDSENVEILYIDPFENTSAWWNPTGSGSTQGVLAGTSFGSDKIFYVPASWERPFQKRSAKLTYVWDTTSNINFIREYLAGTPRKVTFDTTYTLQCYVFGDSSSNLFRFSLDENASKSTPYEVSIWYVLDWVGWRVVEWDFSDPGLIGEWLGDQKLNGYKYSFDSFQLKKGENGLDSSAIYLDELRLVKKGFAVDIKEENRRKIVKDIILLKNYPNPFNPTTTIEYKVNKPAYIKLNIYTITGQKVKTLVDEFKEQGKYEAVFNANGLPSGVYLYQIDNGRSVISRKMILLK